MSARMIWLEVARGLHADVGSGCDPILLTTHFNSARVVFRVPPTTGGAVTLQIGTADETLRGRIVSAAALPRWTPRGGRHGLGAPAPETGDDAFDAAALQLEENKALTARLTDAARPRLARLLTGGAFVHDGVITLRPLPEHSPGSAADALELLREAALLTTQLAAPTTATLLQTAVSDSAPGVRYAARTLLLDGGRVLTGHALKALARHRPPELVEWLLALQPSGPKDIEPWLQLADGLDDERLRAPRIDLTIRHSDARDDPTALRRLAADLAERLARGERSPEVDLLLAKTSVQPTLGRALIAAIREAPSPAGLAWVRRRAIERGAVDPDALDALMVLDREGAVAALRGMRPARRPDARQVVRHLVALGTEYAGPELVWWLTERWSHVGDLASKPVARALAGWLSADPSGGPAAPLTGRRLPRDFLDDALERLAAHPPTDGARWVLGLVGLTDGQRRHAAAVLGHIGDPVAEAWLIEALDGLPALRVAAAEALGRCGTLSALSDLEPHTGGLFTDGRVKAAARAAVAAIQRRAETPSRGGLSMTSAAGGELSLDGEDGERELDGES